MAKLCERPGCSDPGAAEYGMVPEDLLFWIAPLVGTQHDDQNVLCLRHADDLTVPRGWTLDDRREEFPRLFRPAPTRTAGTVTRPDAQRRRRAKASVEQLVIDGTGEIERPTPTSAEPSQSDEPAAATPWRPTFDHDSDLDGLLETDSPLLARAFRGTGRARD